ncbi:MAG: NAD(P)/FAD-dependent oxidoreductase [Opitutales bacterium]
MSDRKKIAVIGAGISGLGAAYLLWERADVTIYEREGYLGGHSRTLTVEVEGRTVPVDTGFIVFNDRNYPLLNQLFKELEVPVTSSDMSFGVSIDNGWLEYGSTGLMGLFGSVRNVLRPHMWRMIRDILIFNHRAIRYLRAPANLTLEDCLNEIGVGRWFRDYYLLPMGGSIWSCPVEQMLKFPAATFLRFFHNHGLTTISDHPKWYSVLGGSREYVMRMIQRMGTSVRIRPGVVSVERRDDQLGIQVTEDSGRVSTYDEVIIATHPDQALGMIKNPTKKERRILSAFRYQSNEVILHTDASFMPKRRSAWASWVYRSEEREDHQPAISLSYWMNNLQSLDTETPVIVTLNPSRKPAPGCVLNRHTFDHPVFDQAAIRAQERVNEIQGRNGLWFCGAYQRNGFHEDGLWSAVRVVESMGVEIPWQ